MPKLDTAEPNTGLRERARERLEKQRDFNGVSPVQSDLTLRSERPDAWPTSAHALPNEMPPGE